MTTLGVFEPMGNFISKLGGEFQLSIILLIKLI